MNREDHPNARDQEVRNGHHDRVVRHMQQVQNISHSQPDSRQNNASDKNAPRAVWRGKKHDTVAVHTTTMSATPAKTNFGSDKIFPVPPQHRNCDITGKKDALSAISRAKSQDCKDFLHNVTCLQMAGLLYDTDVRRECPIRNAGRNYEAVPLTKNSGGPPTRIVFLFSLHGRAFRQVKRLFKAVYHRDHYYFIHVDSVSWTRV